MNLRIVTQPTAEPLTLGEVMSHLNIGLDVRHEDAWINAAIRRAREAAENFLNVTLTDAVYEYRVDAFGSCIALPIGSVGTIAEITYIDEDGAEQTLATTEYVFDDHPRKPVIRRAYDVTWPDTRAEANAVKVTFQGVHSETSSPPNSPDESIKGAMLLMIGHWHENREAVNIGNITSELPFGAMYLLQPYRTSMGV